jgi:hypothetical protein
MISVELYMLKRREREREDESKENKVEGMKQ